MLFALVCTDRPGALERRLAARPEHIAYLERHVASLVHAGALLDPQGNPCGSLFVLDVADRDAAEAFAAGDPFATAGVFESAAIRPFRQAFKDGAKLG